MVDYVCNWGNYTIKRSGWHEIQKQSWLPRNGIFLSLKMKAGLSPHPVARCIKVRTS